jgi:hypothetical protein
VSGLARELEMPPTLLPLKQLRVQRGLRKAHAP